LKNLHGSIQSESIGGKIPCPKRMKLRANEQSLFLGHVRPLLELGLFGGFMAVEDLNFSSHERKVSTGAEFDASVVEKAHPPADIGVAGQGALP
jgi:hypothetical protein